MRGLKSQKMAQLVMDGWVIHYNYFRPHESLKDKTPAEAARISQPLANWEDVARLDVRPFSRERILQAKGVMDKPSPFLSRRIMLRPLLRTRRGGLG